MTDTSRPMVLKRQLLHSVNGSGKIILSEKMLDEAAAKVRRMNVEYEELRKQAQVFRIRQKTLLAAQLEMLKKDEEDDN